MKRTKTERLRDLEEEIEKERQQPIYTEEEKQALMEAIRRVSKAKRNSLLS